jgi:hypothetical protein
MYFLDAKRINEWMLVFDGLAIVDVLTTLDPCLCVPAFRRVCLFGDGLAFIGAVGLKLISVWF